MPRQTSCRMIVEEIEDDGDAMTNAFSCDWRANFEWVSML